MALNQNTRALLDDVETELDRLQKRIKELMAARKALRSLLDSAKAEAAPSKPKRGGKPKLRIRMRMRPVLESAMADGKPHTNQELGAIAKAKHAILDGEPVDLRVINATMLGLQRDGLAIRDNGKWIRK